MIPILISSMGVIPKSLSQSLTWLNLHPNTYIQLQKSVILGTCSNCKKLFTLQVRPPSLILLITTSQDRWIFPSQSWEVKNSTIIIFSFVFHFTIIAVHTPQTTLNVRISCYYFRIIFYFLQEIWNIYFIVLQYYLLFIKQKL